MNCLIGYTGFVGSNILNYSNNKYEYLINSKNIETIKDKEFNTVICAGVSAKKWQANEKPIEDLENINKLLNVLKTIKCDKFILISTIDIYKNTYNNIDKIINQDNHAYGRNRYYLEKELEKQFDNLYIIRLPGLFGYNLQKNVIYDLINNNNPTFNINSKFQWYYIGDIVKDINKAIENKDKIVDLFPEPIKMSEIVEIIKRYSNKEIIYKESNNIITYDLYYKNNQYYNNKKYITEKLELYIWNMLNKNVCISNLAYDIKYTKEIEKIEEFYGIEYKEIVPYKTFGENFINEKLEYFDKYKNMKIHSMQSLLYPKKENILKLEDYMKKIIEIAGYLDIKYLIFGSPKNRKKEETNRIEFINLMKRLGEYAIKHNTKILIEANSIYYGCNFITNITQCKKILEEINSEGVKLHLDISNMYLEKENFYDIITENKDNIEHIHFSGINLETLTNENINYRNIFILLKNINYKNKISLEILNKTSEEVNLSLKCFL